MVKQQLAHIVELQIKTNKLEKQLAKVEHTIVITTLVTFADLITDTKNWQITLPNDIDKAKNVSLDVIVKNNKLNGKTINFWKVNIKHGTTYILGPDANWDLTTTMDGTIPRDEIITVYDAKHNDWDAGNIIDISITRNDDTWDDSLIIAGFYLAYTSK